MSEYSAILKTVKETTEDLTFGIKRMADLVVVNFPIKIGESFYVYGGGPYKLHHVSPNIDAPWKPFVFGEYIPSHGDIGGGVEKIREGKIAKFDSNNDWIEVG